MAPWGGMEFDRQQRIRERARALWVADGSMPGRDQAYWLLAEQMVNAEDEAEAFRDRGREVNESRQS